ncbi:MAG: lytic murein transglycosylase [Rhodospirillaceae bacterium]|jgi:soluble lytic murein transglycosylase|nr:lytic murein transglycosylase [Rhodospirillaceae bacterium]
MLPIRPLFLALVLLPVAGPATGTHAAQAASAQNKRPDATLSPEDRTLYRLAFTAAQAGKWKSAARLAGRAKAKLPAEILDWLHFKQPQPTASFAEITAFIDGHADWPAQAALRRSAEAAALRAKDNNLLRTWFQRHPPQSGSGKLALAELLLGEGRQAAGLAQLRDAWVNGKFPYRDERRFYRRHRKLLAAGDHEARLDRLIWDRQRRGAYRMLRRVNGEARLLGRARLALMESSPSVDAAIARVPSHLRHRPGLVFERVRWRRLKGRYDDAVAFLIPPPAELGRAGPWWRERRILARQALNRGHISESYYLARDHGQNEPAAVAEAEWLAGWLALRFLDEAEVAAQHFLSIYPQVRYPVSLARAAYWAGRAAMAQDDSLTAEAWYGLAAVHPTTYHGQLALLALDAGAKLDLPPAPPPNRADVERFNRRRLVDVCRVLAELEQREHLRPFLLALEAATASPGERALVARLARELGRIDLSVALAKRAARAGVALIQRGYPVLRLATHKDVERALLLALARQESLFDTAAVSRAGALGLTQLMPGTARKLAKRHKLRYSRHRLLSDADYNARLGSTYLAELLQLYRGSYVLALAAYNAGTPRVKRWLRNFGDPRRDEVDAIDWIEQIPFGETRDYVQRVLGNLQVYRQLLADRPVALRLLADLKGK